MISHIKYFELRNSLVASFFKGGSSAGGGGRILFRNSKYLLKYAFFCIINLGSTQLIKNPLLFNCVNFNLYNIRNYAFAQTTNLKYNIFPLGYERLTIIENNPITYSPKYYTLYA